MMMAFTEYLLLGPVSAMGEEGGRAPTRPGHIDPALTRLAVWLREGDRDVWKEDHGLNQEAPGLSTTPSVSATNTEEGKAPASEDKRFHSDRGIRG